MKILWVKCQEILALVDNYYETPFLQNLVEFLIIIEFFELFNFIHYCFLEILIGVQCRIVSIIEFHIKGSWDIFNPTIKGMTYWPYNEVSLSIARRPKNMNKFLIRFGVPTYPLDYLLYLNISPNQTYPACLLCEEIPFLLLVNLDDVSIWYLILFRLGKETLF